MGFIQLAGKSGVRSLKFNHGYIGDLLHDHSLLEFLNTAGIAGI